VQQLQQQQEVEDDDNEEDDEEDEGEEDEDDEKGEGEEDDDVDYENEDETAFGRKDLVVLEIIHALNVMNLSLSDTHRNAIRVALEEGAAAKKLADNKKRKQREETAL
jgi:hypothetical protein